MAATNPHEIAAHTADCLRRMRGASDIADLKLIFSAWRTWADQHGVCQQIRAHVIGAFAEINQSLSSGRPAPVALSARRPAPRRPRDLGEVADDGAPLDMEPAR